MWHANTMGTTCTLLRRPSLCGTSTPKNHTVEHDPSIKIQLASRNLLEGQICTTQHPKILIPDLGRERNIY